MLLRLKRLNEGDTKATAVQNRDQITDWFW